MYKITLLTAASSEYWKLLQLSGRNKLDYCLRHHVQLSVKLHKNIFSPWGEREQFMIQSLEECDWLWFMGADTLIMNQTIDVRKFLNTDYDLIIGKDIYGINNDVFFLQKTNASKLFLTRVLTMNSSVADDQQAMNKVIETMPELRVSIVPQKQFNSYIFKEYESYYPKNNNEGNFEVGDFILHLPGLTNTRRVELINEYLPKVIV